MLEVLVGGVVLSIVVLGLALLSSYGQSFVVAGGGERIAVYLAQQRLEEMRTVGFASVTDPGNATVFNAQASCSGSTGWEAVPNFSGFVRCTTITNGIDLDNSGILPRVITVTVKSTVREAGPVTVTAVYFSH